MTLRKLHLGVGILGLLVFSAQGQYMAHVLEVPELQDTQRMLYRSAHIYFMLACAINLCVGYFGNTRNAYGVVDKVVERIASALFLLAPVLLLYSFFFEVSELTLYRPLLKLGLYGVFGGAALLGLRVLLICFKPTRES